ncbi:hypothetical protein PMIN01_05061 [Paraphaeosphaeria minitans]|uniref:Uncharacterized protein n=1 Tax=Paraphaeosphaeria minitans TaxID=565426 RepID=A0A9P6GK82_9PLEO|nr:hypothetical protein PMIN01_05061 [Paraphaeosphaeria minitans]
MRGVQCTVGCRSTFTFGYPSLNEPGLYSGRLSPLDRSFAMMTSFGLFQFLVQIRLLCSWTMRIPMPRTLMPGYIDIGKSRGRAAYRTGLLFEPKFGSNCTTYLQ